MSISAMTGAGRWAPRWVRALLCGHGDDAAERLSVEEEQASGDPVGEIVLVVVE